MSLDYGNLCSLILKRYFGEVVESVGNCLFNASSRVLADIIKHTGLPRVEVSNALCVLIKFRLVGFNASSNNPMLAEYTLKREEILYILRYPRYIHLVQQRFGSVGSVIVEEFLNSGYRTCSSVILKCISHPENKEQIETYRDKFFELVEDNFLVKLPLLLGNINDDQDAVPKLQTDVNKSFQLDDIDIQEIKQIKTGDADINHFKDAGIFWHINFNRFHQEFLYSLMINAAERKLDQNAGECLQHILKHVYERTDFRQKQFSNAFTYAELKQIIEKKSNNVELIKYLDQYISIIVDDSLGFLRKIGEIGNGQYVVDLEHTLEELITCCVESIITERFGSKAARIFRVIRMRKYTEQEDLQKEAMIPAKEAKLLSYNLFQEQFIQIKTIRKVGGGGSGPSKTFYLFHLKHRGIVKMLLDTCFKALYNVIMRSNYENNSNKRLIEKSQKLDSIVATMKDRGGSEEYITEILETLTPPEREILTKIKLRIKTLSKAELTVDETILLLQMHMYHSSDLISKENSKKNF